MSQFDDDIDTMLADFGEQVLVLGAASGNAIRDAWDEDVQRGVDGRGVTVGLVAMLVRTSAFPGLANGVTVVVQDKDATGAPIAPGAQYKVVDRQRPIESADGRLTRLLLQALP